MRAGDRVGPYEVVSKVGEGGMGEVYRAHDGRLGRDVALKVLPGLFSRDPDRLARFRREAHLLASLNHPNIAQIHGFEETEGVQALVMELVAGRTLAERLVLGAIPIDEALPIARQIADALEAAHEQGVIHRDLKPGNIKVRDDGTVKVLDFGLAKALDPAGGLGTSAPPLLMSQSPTLTSPAMTQVGMILGTAAYMSPEQARGRPVDRRTDIWAFGCVLYEMLTGRRPFEGEDVSDTLANVLKREPAMDALPADVPPRVRQVIAACLQKSRQQRLGDMHDVRLAIDGAFETTLNAGSAAAPAKPLRLWQRPVPAALIALLLMAIAGAAGWVQRPSEPVPAPVTRFVFALPEGQRLALPAAVPRIAVSPDGRTLVYAANGQLYRRDLDDPEPEAIPGTADGATMPAFSPDGQSIAYMAMGDASRRLTRTIPASGGTAVTIQAASAATARGAFMPGDASLTWTGGRILGTAPSGIWAVPERGGEAETLVSLDPTVEVASAPQVIDGGRHLLFTLRRVDSAGPESFSLIVQRLDGDGRRRVLVESAREGTLLPTGHLLYLRGSNLMAAAVDAQRLEIIGAPVVVGSDVGVHFAVSPGGTLVYEPFTGPAGPQAPVWLDRRGVPDPIPMPPQDGRYFRLSPTGDRLAIGAAGEVRIWTFSTRRMTRLTEGPTGQWDVAWMPDGRRLAFSAQTQKDALEIVQKAADGSGAATVLIAAPGGFPNSVSPDGRFLVYHVGRADGVMLKPLAPPGESRQLVPNALNAVISPDGHWMAYQTAGLNRPEIFVRRFPTDDGSPLPVSSGGGRYPLWSPAGGELFYVDPAGMLTAVPVEVKSGFAAGPPQKLFSIQPYDSNPNSRPFDVSRDGSRFVFAPVGVQARPSLVVVSNWFAELTAKFRE